MVNIAQVLEARLLDLANITITGELFTELWENNVLNVLEERWGLPTIRWLRRPRTTGWLYDDWVLDDLSAGQPRQWRHTQSHRHSCPLPGTERYPSLVNCLPAYSRQCGVHTTPHYSTLYQTAHRKMFPCPSILPGRLSEIILHYELFLLFLD